MLNNVRRVAGEVGLANGRVARVNAVLVDPCTARLLLTVEDHDSPWVDLEGCVLAELRSLSTLTRRLCAPGATEFNDVLCRSGRALREVQRAVMDVYIDTYGP